MDPPCGQPDAAATSSEQLAEDFLRLRARMVTLLAPRFPQELPDDLRRATARQVEALEALLPDGLAMRDFALRLGISQAAATVLADRLVDCGYADRQRQDQDRRVVELRCTEAGACVVEEYRAHQRENLSRFVAQLTPDQAKVIVEVMEAIALSVGDPADEGANVTAVGGG